MKVIFWMSAVAVFIANCFLFMGFVNVYFKNFNGGPSSSSGSIVYQLIFGAIILIGGLICYFSGLIKWATFIMAAPIVVVILYLFFFLLLPYLMGERMN